MFSRFEPLSKIEPPVNTPVRLFTCVLLLQLARQAGFANTMGLMWT